MNNRKDASLFLSKALNSGLLKKFGKVPSANTFADQFNLRAYGTKTITRETARKWLLGLSMPEIDRLVVLVKWLDIDVSRLFGQDRIETSIQNGAINQYEKSNNNVLHNKYITSEDIEHLINNCLKELNTHSKNALLITAWMLIQLESDSSDMDLFKKLIIMQLKPNSSSPSLK